MLCSRPGKRWPNWSIMSAEPQFTLTLFLHAQFEGFGVEDLGGVHDRRWIALDGISGGQARRISLALTNRPARPAGGSSPKSPGSSRPSGRSACSRTPADRRSVGVSWSHRKRTWACRMPGNVEDRHAGNRTHQHRIFWRGRHEWNLTVFASQTEPISTVFALENEAGGTYGSRATTQIIAQKTNCLKPLRPHISTNRETRLPLP